MFFFVLLTSFSFYHLFGVALIDDKGYPVKNINVIFGTTFINQFPFSSEVFYLNVVDIENKGVIKGEIHNCTIGKKKLDTNKIKLKLNGKDSLNISKNGTRFSVQTIIEDVGGLKGNLECQYATLKFEPY